MKKLTIATMIMSLIAISAIIFNVVNNVEDIVRLTTFEELDYTSQSVTGVGLFVRDVEKILAAEHASEVQNELQLPETFEYPDEALKQIQEVINYWGYDEENKYRPGYDVVNLIYYFDNYDGQDLIVFGSITQYHGIPFSFSLNYSDKSEPQTFEDALKKLKLDEDVVREEVDRVIALRIEKEKLEHETKNTSNMLGAATITEPVQYAVTEDSLIIVYNTDYVAGGAIYSEEFVIPLDYLEKIAK